MYLIVFSILFFSILFYFFQYANFSISSTLKAPQFCQSAVEAVKDIPDDSKLLVGGMIIFFYQFLIIVGIDY